MDAVEFLKEYHRMCKQHTVYDEALGWVCKKDCPIEPYRDTTDLLYCEKTVFNKPIDAIKAVEKWSKEHPRKTRLQDFLEKYPNALVEKHLKIPVVCCLDLGYCDRCEDLTKCEECWNKEVGE